MVRLAITDFATKEESEYFYVNEEYETSQNMFTYSAFKKYSAYLPKEGAYRFYSLNILSKWSLNGNWTRVTSGEFLKYAGDKFLRKIKNGLSYIFMRNGFPSS